MADEQSTSNSEFPRTIDAPNGFLGRADIHAHWDSIFVAGEKGEPVPMPLEGDDEWEKNPASVDLRLGSEYFVSSSDRPDHLSDERPYLTIPRGEFALLMTWERLSIPENILALISTRTRLKMQGLINVSGFHVDPGFRGKLVYAVYNSGPRDILLTYKEPVFTIFFSTLASPARYNGEYQEQLRIPPAFISNLGGNSLPASLPELDRQVAEDAESASRQQASARRLAS